MKIHLPWYYGALICALIAFAPNLYAQTPTPVPEPPAKPVWTHQTEELLLSGSFTRNAVTQKWQGILESAWAHYATDQTQIGAALSYANDGTVQGTGVGPFYRYNFPKLRFGNFFLGGTAQYLTGDLGVAANVAAASELGYRLYVGDSSALFISAKQTKPLFGGTNPDSLDNFTFAVGFSMGIKQGAPVQ